MILAITLILQYIIHDFFIISRLAKIMQTMLASYASNPEKSLGRLYPEKPTTYRNEFQRDKDRIIHSNSFRRLEYKTQVFVNHEGDHYRNRLTHSIEVASVARSIADTLGLSADLAEAISLAHDMGHTPFAHAGEDALDECMKVYGGFCHNAHSIKLLTSLEQRYGAYSGLNLTWEVLEGIAKHNGPVEKDIPEVIVAYNKIHDLDLQNYSSGEAQVSALSDDIAYNGHDIEDGVRAGLIRLDELAEIKLVGEYLEEVRTEFPQLSINRQAYELTRHLIHYFIDDLLNNTRDNLKNNNIKTIKDIRYLGKPVVAFSKKTEEDFKDIKEFLFKNLYRHEKVVMMTFKARQVVTKLFDLYMNSPEAMRAEWRSLASGEVSDTQRAIVVADYIAGMTDRYAIREYQALHNL